MRRPSPAERAPSALPSGLLLVGAALTVVWAGLGHRLGPHWYRWLSRHRPAGIILHHTASDGRRNGKLLDAAMLDADHAAKEWGVQYGGRTYHIAYHYLILADGSVEPGRPEGAPGAHTRGHPGHLGVCLVGNFSGSDNPGGRMQPAEPTPKQMRALEGLLLDLMRRYDLTVDDVYCHRDFRQTSCPGDRFPFDDLVRNLRGAAPPAPAARRVDTGQEP